MYICKHFKIHELVGPEVHAARGEKAWQLLDDRALETLDALRDKFGALTVNDWFWGGRFTESGLRTPGDKHYKPYSQHSFGRAFDCKFKGISAEEVRKYVLANKKEFPFLTSYENVVTWFHFDVRNVEAITVFNP
jgi:hypothetical protein